MKNAFALIFLPALLLLTAATNPNTEDGATVVIADIRTFEISDAGVYTSYGYITTRAQKVTAFDFVCNKAAAGTSQATTVKLQNGATVIATFTTSFDGGTAGITAGRKFSATLSSTAADLLVASGTLLKMVVTTAAGNNLKADCVGQIALKDEGI